MEGDVKTQKVCKQCWKVNVVPRIKQITSTLHKHGSLHFVS